MNELIAARVSIVVLNVAILTDRPNRHSPVSGLEG